MDFVANHRKVHCWTAFPPPSPWSLPNSRSSFFTAGFALMPSSASFHTPSDDISLPKMHWCNIHWMALVTFVSIFCLLASFLSPFAWSNVILLFITNIHLLDFWSHQHLQKHSRFGSLDKMTIYDFYSVVCCRTVRLASKAAESRSAVNQMRQDK